MAEIVNLRMARKRKAREEAAAAAAEARAKHGRTKAERDLERARAEKAEREAEAHRLERTTPVAGGTARAAAPTDSVATPSPACRGSEPAASQPPGATSDQTTIRPGRGTPPLPQHRDVPEDG
jgi:membrane protein involved in colicin uptake